jgi:hypothetical protein
MRSLAHIIGVKIVNNVKETNELLGTGEWELLNTTLQTDANIKDITSYTALLGKLSRRAIEHRIS